MLDARVIGSYISKLRKEADLTQGELADRLNVTHQAVSKWERGESLPDIGTLMELAKVFNQSVDQILYGGKSRHQGRPIDPLVEKIAKKQPEDAGELLEKGEITIDGLVDVAPLIKTSVLQRVTEKIDKSKFTLNHVIDLAPFLDEKTLDDLLSNISDVTADWDTMCSLAPFLSPEVIATFVEKAMLVKPTLNYVVALAPFMGKYTDHLAKEVVRDSNATWDDIVSLAPFINHETLKRLIKEILELEPKISEVADIAPFLHESTDEFVQQALSNDEEISWETIEGLAPFIKPDTLTQLIDQSKDITNLSFNQFVELAPFLRDKADEFFIHASKNNISWNDIESIAPFVKRDTLSAIIDESHVKPSSATLIVNLAPFLEQEKLSELLGAFPTDELEPEVITELAPFMKKSIFSELIGRLIRKE